MLETPQNFMANHHVPHYLMVLFSGLGRALGVVNGYNCGILTSISWDAGPYNYVGHMMVALHPILYSYHTSPHYIFTCKYIYICIHIYMYIYNTYLSNIYYIFPSYNWNQPSTKCRMKTFHRAARRRGGCLRASDLAWPLCRRRTTPARWRAGPVAVVLVGFGGNLGTKSMDNSMVLAENLWNLNLTMGISMGAIFVRKSIGM